MSKLLGSLLFCNVLAIGLGMFMNSAGWIEYVNLFGCVIFGAWCASDA